MTGRLAHEITGAHQFVDYYEAELEMRITPAYRRKVFKELEVKWCNYPSHKYDVDCPDGCHRKFIESLKNLNDQTTRDAIKKSKTLMMVYLEAFRDYEYINKIQINDNNV
jgi:hypothetical protein